MSNLYLLFTRLFFATRIYTTRVILITMILAFAAGTAVQAQLSLTNGSPSALIDFSNTMPTTVGTTPSTAFLATGFSPNPGVAGRLNSNAWAWNVPGAPLSNSWSDGNLAFGGTQTGNDFGRGAVAVAQTTGGIYSYVGAPHNAANPALMLQPGGSDCTPGALTLRIQNNGTSMINQLAVSYNIYVRNDQNRSQSFNFSYSTDNVNFTPVGAMDYATPTTLDVAGWVVVPGTPSRATTISSIAIAPTSFIYIRWATDDISGSGARDEIGLDDINLVAYYPGVCTPPTINATLNSFTSVLSNQMDVNFTRGNGTGGLLIVASPAVLSSNPISGIVYATNTNYGAGAAIGNGFVVYNSNAVANFAAGSTTITGLTAGVTYNINLFEYDVTGPCYTLTGTLGTQITALTSLANVADLFRSRVNGDWPNANTWQYSNDGGTTWNNADIAPGSASAGILIQAAHTVDIASPVTIDQTTVAGTLTLSNNGIINLLNNVSSDDIIIQSTGVFKVQATTTNYSTAFVPAASATINVATAGKIIIGNGGSTSGYSPLGYTSGFVIWNDASILEWNTTDPFVTSGVTYFPDAALGVVPIFRLSRSPSLQPGAGAATGWNGLFEVNAAVTLKLGGTKTFRNGIIGTADLTQDELCGQFIINGITAKLGGTGAINLNTSGLVINTASVTTMISNKTVNSTLGLGTFLLTGSASLYCDSYIMSGSAIFSLSAASTMRLGDPGGISGSGATGNIQVSGLRTYNMNTSFIFNGTALQVTGNGMPTTLTALTIINTGGAGNNTVSLTTTNTSTQALTLTTGLLAIGTAQQLNILTTGTVTATAGNFATGVTGGILNFPGTGNFSGTSSPYNVYVSGAVDFGLGIVTIQNGGSFQINTGGSANTRGPYYADGSTLIYNTGLGFGAGFEWVAGAATSAARGGPHHVTILASGTAVNFGASVTARTMRGNLIISSGTTFILSTAAGGNLNIGGDWTRAATGIFTNNARTVNFNGLLADQTITVTGAGTETFGYLTLTKSVAFPNLILAGASNATNVTLDGNPASGAPSNTLVLTGSSNLDLNQNTFNFTSWNGNQNNIQVDGNTATGGTLIRNINSTGGQGVFAIFNNTAATRVVTISRAATAISRRAVLIFSSNVKVTTGAVFGGTGGIDFGVTVSGGTFYISTINGILQIDIRGFVTVNAPTYGANSTLVYNTTGTYNRFVEWGSTVIQPGYPSNVTIQNNSTLNLNNLTNPPNANRYMAGTLTIGNGSALVMNSSGSYLPSILTVGTNQVLDGILTLPGTLPAFGEDIHIVGNWTRSATGVFNPNDRAVYFEGATNSTITANGGETFPYLRLTKNTNALSLLLSDNINITKEFSITTGIFNLQSKDATFKSDASYTASLTAINPANGSISYGGGAGIGRFIVERFIPTGTGGVNHGRTWQFLAVPTKGSTINQSWQEGYAPLAFTPAYNYGTTISSEQPSAVSRGYDFYTYPGPSMKSYDYSIGASGAWVSVDDGATNTNAKLIDNPKGYMLFVRGDRSVQTSATTATPTTMRTRGKLYSPGAEAPATVTVQANKYESIGNPYASAIDFTLLTLGANVDNAFYVWDPTLGGSYGLGGYQTISSAGGWIPSSAGTTNYPAATANSKLQSGQAFLVHATATPLNTVGFTEAAKVSGSAVVFRPAINNNPSVMRSVLYSGTGNTANIADGNIVAFDRNYRNGYDGNDAVKFMNTGENFGMSKFEKILSVEARRPVVYTDTIFYNLTNLRKQAYEFRFAPENLDIPGLHAYLVDKFHQTTTAVSLSSETDVVFAITDNPASAAADRFMIIFRKRGGHHFIFSNLKAARQENDVFINWETEEGNDGVTYEVERSADGINFSSIHTEQANGNTGYSWKDTDPLPGLNYYRIHNLDKDNAGSSYSNKEKVLPTQGNDVVTVYLNPVKNGLLGLQFNSNLKGTYYLQLYNSAGQLIWKNDFYQEGLKIKSTFKLPVAIAKGIYKLDITQPDGTRCVKQVFID